MAEVEVLLQETIKVSTSDFLFWRQKFCQINFNKKPVLSQRRPRDAPYISLPWKFWRVRDYPHAPLSPEYVTASCSDWACECSGQIWSS